MKKILLLLLSLIILCLGAIYGILFTNYGNNLIASYIENKVNEGQENVKLKVNDFKL